MVGFETTAPANAMAVYQAHREGLTNFSRLVAHVLVPPAIEALLAAPDNRLPLFKRVFRPGIDDLALIGFAQVIPSLFPFVELQSKVVDEDLRRIQRQAFAGVLWSKQYFYYDVTEWLDGDPSQAGPFTELVRLPAE